LKTPTGEEAFNPNGLAQRSIALLKDTFPDLEARVPSARRHQPPDHYAENPSAAQLVVAMSAAALATRETV